MAILGGAAAVGTTLLLALWTALLRPVQAEQECRAYYNLNGKVYHESFTCPRHCCGNAFVKYCCDDPAKTSVGKHYDAHSVADSFVILVLGLMTLGMMATGIYTFCFLCRPDRPPARSRSSSVSRPDSTAATAIDIEDIGPEFRGSSPSAPGPGEPAPVTVQPAATAGVLQAPPYGAPSCQPPPYDESTGHK